MRGSDTHSSGGSRGQAQVEGLVELSQAASGEWSLNPQTHSPTGVRDP